MAFRYWLALLLSLPTTLLAADNRPDGYNLLCKFGETCSLKTPSLVAFGAKEVFTYKVLSGSFVCDLATFGRDPAPALPQKACSIAPHKSKLHSKSSSGSSSSSSGVALVNATTLPPGRYAIISRHSGKALEISAQGNVIQNEYNGSKAQIWDVSVLSNGFYAIKSASLQQALSLADWSQHEGARVTESPWLDSHNQHWAIAGLGGGSFSLVSRFNGKALDVVQLNTQNQAPVRLWTYWGGDNQQWQFAPAK
jgi:hypothetical protein